MPVCMPRIPRHLTVMPDYQVHKIWRGHNREWNLKASHEKQKYTDLINDELTHSPNALHTVVLMSNHTHEIYTVTDVPKFSNEMRRSHGRYGMYFNRLHRRCGKVAQDRPRTCTIEADDYAMRATFYIHANPLRAKIVKDANHYKWSTHSLYAFGKRLPWMKRVVLPGWYLALGDTMLARQRRYRRLFDEYLEEVGLRKLSFHQRPFYGSQAWQLPYLRSITAWRRRDLAPPE